MSEEAKEPAPRSARIRRALWLLLASWVAYVALVEIAVRTGFAERWLSRRPHKLVVAFDSAHSWFPFWGTASGIDARGQAPRVRWQARVDRASGWLSPLALLGRRIRVRGALASCLRCGGPGLGWR